MSSVRRKRTGRRLRALTVVVLGAGGGLGAAPAPSFYDARVQPIFAQACVGCHGPEKTRGGLQLHTFAAVVKGGESGAVLRPGGAKESELFRRLLLPEDDDEAMPPTGKARLSASETEILRRWIQAGAPGPGATVTVDIADLVAAPVPEAAPDYRSFSRQLAELENSLPVRFAPVSEKPTDGLILRTVSAASEVDDRVLERLAPVAALIVDAELARTAVTDEGLAALGRFQNLRRLDLAHTRVTAGGLKHLTSLARLETLNLVGTATNDEAWASLRQLPGLLRIHTYGTAMSR